MEQSVAFVFMFYFLALATLGAAAVTALSRNLVTAAFALFVALLGQSGFFLLLGSDFLGVVQVVVYVGGILTLLLFGILLTNRDIGSVSGVEETAKRTPALIAGGGLLALLIFALGASAWRVPTPSVEGAAVAAYSPKTVEIGANLLSRHLLAFELSAMLLLAALLGAAYLVRRRDV
jgi:NADH:ubiquinone oxidoreductase subunit 6 (subunit J)